jgi:ADP-ribose pyrophosphatase
VTASCATLPEPPTVELETVGETRLGEGGFLVLRRMRLVIISAGKRSEAFEYDALDRRAVDSAVMIAHHVAEGRVWVWLRSSLRPPLALRRDPRPTIALWEIPAGLLEPGESPRAGAVRELAEELGFAVSEEDMLDLGPPSLPASAFIGEAHHFFHVEVDPSTRKEPAGDGSAVEADASVICIPLDEAIAALHRGQLGDVKTEISLRRLAEVLREAPTPS